MDIEKFTWNNLEVKYANQVFKPNIKVKAKHKNTNTMKQLPSDSTIE